MPILTESGYAVSLAKGLAYKTVFYPIFVLEPTLTTLWSPLATLPNPK